MGVTFTDATAASGSATGILGSTILQDARLLLNAKTFPSTITMTGAGIVQRAQQIVGAGDFPGSISMTGAEVVQQARELLNAVDYPASITQTAAGIVSRAQALAGASDFPSTITMTGAKIIQRARDMLNALDTSSKVAAVAADITAMAREIVNDLNAAAYRTSAAQMTAFLDDAVRYILSERPEYLIQADGTHTTYADSGTIPFGKELEEAAAHYIVYRIFELDASDQQNMQLAQHHRAIAEDRVARTTVPQPAEMVGALNDGIEEILATYPHLLLQSNGTYSTYTHVTAANYASTVLPVDERFAPPLAHYIVSRLLYGKEGKQELAAGHDVLFRHCLRLYRMFPLVSFVDAVNDGVQFVLRAHPELLLQADGTHTAYTEITTSTYNSSALPLAENLREAVARYAAGIILQSSLLDGDYARGEALRQSAQKAMWEHGQYPLTLLVAHMNDGVHGILSAQPLWLLGTDGTYGSYTDKTTATYTSGALPVDERLRDALAHYVAGRALEGRGGVTATTTAFRAIYEAARTDKTIVPLVVFVFALNDAVHDVLRRWPAIALQTNGSYSAYTDKTTATYTSGALPFGETLREPAAQLVAARVFEVQGDMERAVAHRTLYERGIRDFRELPLAAMVRLLNLGLQDLLARRPQLLLGSDGDLDTFTDLTTSTYASQALPVSETYREALAHYVAYQVFSMDAVQEDDQRRAAIHRQEYLAKS